MRAKRSSSPRLRATDAGSANGKLKREMSKIRLAIVGVGNCASSLLQGLEYYRHAPGGEQHKPVGLMHYDIGGYRPVDIEVACAFDIDKRKVGRPLEQACFALPN